MFRLDGKPALITGASGGIGAAIARTLHAQGAVVALSGTRRDALDRWPRNWASGLSSALPICAMRPNPTRSWRRRSRRRVRLPSWSTTPA